MSERARRLLEEDEVLTSAVKTALHTFMEIANKRDNPTELRIDAASRILGYAASSMIPDDIDDDDEEETDDGNSDNDPAIGGTDE